MLKKIILVLFLLTAAISFGQQEILDAFVQSVLNDPDFKLAHYYRGIESYNKGDNDLAIAYFTEAIKLDPNHKEAFFLRGLSFYNKRDYDQAIADFT